MQEEYGIKLKIITRGLKEGINESKTLIKDFAGDTKSMLDEDLKAKGLEKGIQNITNKIEKLKEKMTTQEIGLGEGLIIDKGLTDKELDYLRRLQESLGKLQTKQLDMQLASKKMVSEMNKVDTTKINSFSDFMKQATDTIKKGWTNVIDKIKTSYQEARQPVEVEIHTDKFENQINYIEQKIKDLKNKLKDDNISLLDRAKTEANIERLTNQLNRLKNKTKEVGDEAEQTESKFNGMSINTNVTNKNIAKGLDKGWRAAKKFAFGLLSVRGAYGLVRKASLSYMSQDKQLNKQMQKTWASLGALAMPIIEGLVHAIRVVAAYINYFIKALTGRNLINEAIKKINAYNKSLAQTEKAAKKARRELTPLDEITNLSFDDDDKIEDAAESFDDFSDIKLDPRITKFLDYLADKLREVYKFIKPFIDWAKNNPDTILKILGGVAALKLVSGLVGFLGGGTGLISLLKIATTIGVVALGVDLIYNAATGRHLIDDLKEIIAGMNEISDFRKSNSLQAKGQVENAVELTNAYNKLSGNYKKNEKTIHKLNDSMINNNQTKLAQIKAIKDEINQRASWNKNQKKYAEQIRDIATAEKIQTDAMYVNWKQGKTNKEQTDKFVNAISNQIDKYKELQKNTKNNVEAQKIYQDRIGELEAQLKSITTRDYTCELDLDTKNADNKAKNTKDKLTSLGKEKYKPTISVTTEGEDKTINLKDRLKELAKTWIAKLKLQTVTKDAADALSKFFNPVNDLFKAFGFGSNSIIKSLSGTVLKSLLNKIPKYDVGTPYVPNDMIAQVHKGEMIIPAKYNPATNGIGTGNAETNALLYEMNRNILELSNKPTVLRVNGKDLAQATYNDFTNEGNRLNASKTISIS